MRSLLAGVLMLSLAGVALATDEADRDRRVRAALALSAKPAVAASAKCTCPAGTRGTWEAQLKRAMAEDCVLVLFCDGAEPRCCKGTLIAVMDKLPIGQPKSKPIIVYAPLGSGRLQIVAELSGDATNVQLMAAVDKAKSFASHRSK